VKAGALAIALAIAPAGCMFDYDPDVGAPLPRGDDAGGTSGCDNTDSDLAVATSFSIDVRPLMVRSPGGCATCHLGRMVSGLDLSSYESMRRGGINSGTRVIVASEPCGSILVQKLSRTPPFGSRMPFNGPPYFTAQEQLLVRDWIAEGAENN